MWLDSVRAVLHQPPLCLICVQTDFVADIQTMQDLFSRQRVPLECREVLHRVLLGCLRRRTLDRVCHMDRQGSAGQRRPKRRAVDLPEFPHYSRRSVHLRRAGEADRVVPTQLMLAIRGAHVVVFLNGNSAGNSECRASRREPHLYIHSLSSDGSAARRWQLALEVHRDEEKRVASVDEMGVDRSKRYSIRSPGSIYILFLS